ncbi:MAG: hypothetical protein WCG85_22750 [Polyangia bacterium]|jgi:hypothetical protein
MATTRARIEELAKELAALSPEDRTRVLVEVSRRGPRSAHESQKTAVWQRLHDLEGIVTLGGDAVEDCAHLYDG